MTSKPVEAEAEAEESEKHEEMSWSFALRPRNLYKLFTHEDPLNLHKLIGVFCLVHYLYRLGALALTGSMRFEKDSQPKLVFLFLVHLLLSWSSFVFPLPQKRNQSKPMIWPELRWHNVVFATRSILDALLHILGLGHYCLARVALAMAAMVAADYVSSFYANQSTTMRGMPFPASAGKRFVSGVNLFYALSQIYATKGVINITYTWTLDVELAFLTLFAIQVSALLMTLVRKSVMEPAGWHLVYGLSLFLSWVLIYVRYANRVAWGGGINWTIAEAIIFALGRFVFRLNKFVIWGVFSTWYILNLERYAYVDWPFGV